LDRDSSPCPALALLKSLWHRHLFIIAQPASSFAFSVHPAICTIPPENHRGAEGTEVAQRSQWKEGIRRTQSPAQDGIDLVRVFTPYLALALRESLWHRPSPSTRAQPACSFAFSVLCALRASVVLWMICAESCILCALCASVVLWSNCAESCRVCTEPESRTMLSRRRP
jgi:hypothetical protein